MPKPDLLRRIEIYNRGREPERLAIKYARMRSSAFVFLRGTAHLFYEDWPRRSPLNDAPKAWICGDLHLENFGGYTAADGQPHFDVSDFDEAARAPVTWELARLCVSLSLRAMTWSAAASMAMRRRCRNGRRPLSTLRHPNRICGDFYASYPQTTRPPSCRLARPAKVPRAACAF